MNEKETRTITSLISEHVWIRGNTTRIQYNEETTIETRVMQEMPRDNNNTRIYGSMIWKFDCHSCGHIFTIQNKHITKERFLGKQKRGRPYINCPMCQEKLAGNITERKK
tara:strand:- start:8781 stop:9110 length:330 start_codon:yes stop_codon:yes gene_type:complete